MSISRLPCKALLFDLGGVLVKLTGVPRMMELTRHRFTVAGLWERWIASPAIRAFESGTMSVDEFGPAIVKEFAIDLPAEQYVKEFTVWPSCTFPGVEELLLTLKNEYILASLSNTNVLHWKRVKEDMHLIHHFDYNFPSHETGLLKPDRETFLHVAEAMSLAPGDILFFDDNLINVEGARNAGLNAAEVHGVDDIRSYLRL